MEVLNLVDVLKKSFKESRIKNISNQQFGYWTALYPLKKSSCGHILWHWHWHCKCKCGIEKDINGNGLRRGLRLSCGCLNISHGEYIIK